MFGNDTLTPEMLMALGGGIMQGSNLGTGLGTGLQNASTVMAAQKEKSEVKAVENKTREWLKSQYPGENFDTMSTDMMKTYANEALKNRFAKPKFMTVDGKIVKLDETTGENSVVGDYSTPTEKKRNLISTKNGIYDADTKEWIAPPEGMTTEDSAKYGLQPVWFKDKDGKYKLGVPGTDASFKILPTPADMEPLPGVNNIDQGTTTGVQDKKTGDIIKSLPKDVAGKIEQETIGKEIGAIKAALPSARTTARIVSDQIQQIKDDKSLPDALGSIDSNLPTLFPGTARVESRIEMLTGQSFLQAREMLRGGGQITDYEGQRAEKAMARLNRSQSPEDFKAALDEFNSAVQDGLKKLEAVAAGNMDYGKQPADNPNVESLVEKYRTK